MTRCPTSTSSASASSTPSPSWSRAGSAHGDRPPRPRGAWSSAEAACSARPGWSGRCRRSRTSWAGRPRTFDRRRHVGRVRARRAARGRRRGRGPARPPARGTRSSTRVRWPATRSTTRRDTGGDRPPRPRVGLGSHGCWRATPGSCASCRRPRCCRRSCPRGAVVIDSVGALVSHVVPQGWVPRARAAAWSRSTTTPAQRVPFGAPGAPDVDAVHGGDGVLRHPRVVPAGAHRRPPVHRRRRVVVHQPRPAGRARSRRGLRPRSPGQLRTPTARASWRTRLERQWRDRVTLRCLREVGKVHRRRHRGDRAGAGGRRTWRRMGPTSWRWAAAGMCSTRRCAPPPLPCATPRR